MLTILWMLAGDAAQAGRVTPTRAAECIVVVAEGAMRHGASLTDALAELEWFIRESGCRDDVVNAESGACARGQFLGWGRRGRSCAELRADAVLASVTWFEGLDEAREKCGSTFGALCVLSAGRCDGKFNGIDMRPFVRGRCMQAGLTATCEVP